MRIKDIGNMDINLCIGIVNLILAFFSSGWTMVLNLIFGIINIFLGLISLMEDEKDSTK